MWVSVARWQTNTTVPTHAIVQAAVAEARRHEQTAKALSWELDNMRKLKDDTISELTQQNTQLKHQLKVSKVRQHRVSSSMCGS